MIIKPKLFAFVLMPFSKEFDDVYQLGIKETCNQIGIYCERVDEQVFQETILERIYNQIIKADLIIADMTNKNPNVFYEVGYAHAIGKDVILLTQDSKDIPFDLAHYPHIVYEGKIVSLKNELNKRLSWYINNPSDTSAFFNTSVDIYVFNQLVQDDPAFEVQIPENYANAFSITININNSVDRFIENVSFQVGIITESNISECFRRGTLKQYEQKDKRLIHIIDDYFTIIPGSWESIDLEFYTPDTIEDSAEFKIILRLFFGFGPVDFPFTITVKRKNSE
jgi:hypothetical protein